MKTLLLNADYTPLRLLSGEDGLFLILKSKAEIVSSTEGPAVWNESYATITTSYKIPAVIRLLKQVPYVATIPPFKKGWKTLLFSRDNWMCQYCGCKLDSKIATIEHIVPRARRGETSWKNCVAACKQCNTIKSSSLPKEVGMKLLKQPRIPSLKDMCIATSPNGMHPAWLMFV